MGYKRYPDVPGREAKMRELRATGLPLREIAEMLGCHWATVWEACTPGAKERSNARRRAYNTSPEGLRRQREYRARRAQ